MRIYGIGVNVLKGMSFYDGSRACVRVAGTESECFGVNVGLRQGCVMSPWLFKVYMDSVVKEVYSRTHERGVKLRIDSGSEWVLSRLLFADDTALVAD